MSLRIRRGTDAQRATTPLDLGELVFTTDTKQLYVGNGIDNGGNPIIRLGTGLAWADTACTTIIATGAALQVSADATPRLGGSLTLGGYNISGTGNINITGSITATSNITGGKLILDKSLANSGIIIESNLGGAASTDWLTINTHHNDTDAATAFFTRTRGTKASPTALTNGDGVFGFGFLGRTTGGIIVPAGGISVEVAGTVSSGVLPGALCLWTTDSTGNLTQKLYIGPDGLQTTVAPSLVAGASTGQVDTGTISSWMKINFNGTNYAVPMYAIRP
jgi:hypothetical protein